MSFAQEIVRKLPNWFRKPSEPQDPHTYVAADLKRGLGGRSAAVALDEPAPPRSLRLFGRRLIP